jgi:hypothetical protein
MEFDLSVITSAVAAIASSPVGREMSYRAEGALEITDALRDMVPVIAEAGRQQDRQPPADTADASPAGRRLSGERRTQMRALADTITATQQAALAGRELDESALNGVSLGEMIADPFGFLAPLLDVNADISTALSAVAQTSDLSRDDMLYLRAYMKAAVMSDRTPVLLRALFVTAIGTVEPLEPAWSSCCCTMPNPGCTRPWRLQS